MVDADPFVSERCFYGDDAVAAEGVDDAAFTAYITVLEEGITECCVDSFVAAENLVLAFAEVFPGYV